jgi:transcription factor SPN1
MKMLKEVIKNITKSDLNEVLIEHGIMSALADWISPLPDKSLPSLTIRSELLKVLRRNFLHVSSETLKLSGIGKAVMLLYKHPKELRENKVGSPFQFILLQIKQVCRELVAKWSRPIFGLNDNFSSVSREAREQRDFELLPKQKKKRLKDATERDEDKEEEEADNV